MTAEDERSFLIDTSLHFRSSSFEGEPSFAWRDLDYDDDEEADEDSGELLEFVVDAKQVDRSTLTIFELTMLHCMFERVSSLHSGRTSSTQFLTRSFTSHDISQKYNTSHNEATDAELEALKYTYGPRSPLLTLDSSCCLTF